MKNLEVNRCQHMQLPGLESPWWDEFPWLHYLLDDQGSLFMYCACVENMPSPKKDGVGQCTVPTVLPGEADQTSEP